MSASVCVSILVSLGYRRSDSFVILDVSNEYIVRKWKNFISTSGGIEKFYEIIVGNFPEKKN